MGPSLQVALGSGCVALGSSPNVLGPGFSPSFSAGEDDICVKVVVSSRYVASGRCSRKRHARSVTPKFLLLFRESRGSASVYPRVEPTFVLKDSQHRSVSL